MGRGKIRKKDKLKEKRRLKRKKGLNTPLNLFNKYFNKCQIN